MEPIARRLFRLVEPIHVVTYRMLQAVFICSCPTCTQNQRYQPCSR